MSKKIFAKLIKNKAENGNIFFSIVFGYKHWFIVLLPAININTLIMYAIVEIAGHQYKVRKDQQIYVNRLPQAEGESIQLDRVMLVDNNGDVKVGAPVISGATVDAKVVSHLKADKVIVFKKKRRKGYQKSNGHRQHISLVEITNIKA
jgi:large subunit ribosomal protein L21